MEHRITGNKERYDALAAEYDAWYDENAALFAAEQEAVRRLLPAGRGLEVGAGSGRFTAALGIDAGVEPAPAMRALAASRGLRLTDGTAEALPYSAASFDYVCFLTSLEFVDDAKTALREAHRVLVPSGRLIVAYLNAGSPEGQALAENKLDTPYFQEACFYTPDRLSAQLTQTGFRPLRSVQVVADGDGFAVRDGSGSGLYTVLESIRP